MKKNFTPYIYIIFSILTIELVTAQNFELKIKPRDSTNAALIASVNYKKKHISENSVTSELDSISNKLNLQGFINNKLESLQLTDSIYTATIHLGVPFKNITIIIDAKDLKYVQSKKTELTILTSETPRFLNGIISTLNQQGYPFAKATLKNITTKSNELFANLVVDLHKERTIDKVIVKGYEEFPKKFIDHYLDIKTGSLLKTEKLQEASENLNSLLFASELKAPEILFGNDSTTVYLYIQKRKNNSFDGLLGFSTNDSGKLELNGYLDLQLTNIFNKGESFSFKWKGNGNERTSFDLALSTPFIFNSPVSPSASLNIYKQDSTFINIKAQINATYLINPRNSITVQFKTENSNNLLENNSNIQNFDEFKSTLYGINYTINKTDLTFQNSPIFYGSIGLLFGNRTSKINSFDDNQQKIESEIYYNWFLNRNNSIYIRNTGGILFSQTYLINELFRIGGTNTIRGFDEESILSSFYNITNLEYHYYLNTDSYIYSITDFALTQNKALNLESKLYSFGLGYSYGTKNGVVDISYAMGKLENIPFDLNNSRVHIKFVQFF